MLNGTVESIAKNTLLYSFVLSQPFALYAGVYPIFENKTLLEAEELEYGDHGEAVRILQYKLNELSYYEDQVDGELGVLTEHAIKKFQRDHNMTITGQADKETILALIEVDIDRHIKRLENLSDSVYPGLQSEDVEIVQESLQYFGYYEGEIDGMYGPLTKKAVEIAEEKHDIDFLDEAPRQSLSAMYNSERQQAVTASAQTKPKANIKNVTVSANYSAIIQTAYAHVGTPYVWGGTSPGGFDCSGFLQYVHSVHGVTLPRTVSDLWNFASPVSSLSVGDLVFYETYKPGPSHAGIYLGNGQFIHAGNNGVEVSNMGEAYWQQRYLGAKRIGGN
ncbi:C40 family peptidase [Ornithinibacillus californiensis]|uniref:C40 family peptidase n=1 Tax=Ornithinibacillus californiensis TaxID=161536 RepID=UPI00064DDF5A|nr:NlpC/P60 family protein [Ornithinibacillus californiensis]